MQRSLRVIFPALATSSTHVYQIRTRG